MQYFSTNHNAPKVNFKQATIAGQAPDKGLYFPETIPSITDKIKQLLSPLPKKGGPDSYRDGVRSQLAFEIIKPYVGGEIPDDELLKICEHTVDFDFPLVKVTDDIYSLELFHGPTLAFKDVGARFMSGCLGYFSKARNQKVTVLVATSGDTGSAVANGFLGVDGVDVIILYPSGKVSKIQELQLTTLGQNITALEVQGTFDDCQRMVKEAFTDTALNQKFFLTSANSINVARWLPQQFYYFFALQQWAHTQPPVVCVPSGNFGNICAGLLAYTSGLPAAHFVAACNSNDIFTQYLKTAQFKPRAAQATLSNAMDVGNPSNFARIWELYQRSYHQIIAQVSSYAINDAETTATITRVYQDYNYILDPHGAVGFASLEKYLSQHPGQKGLFLETAHPIKFSDVVEKAIGTTLNFPPAMQYLLQKQKQSILMQPEYGALKGWLMGK